MLGPKFDSARACDPEEIASARRGLAQAKAGQEISNEAMKRWIQSWNTDAELPPPQETSTS